MENNTKEMNLKELEKAAGGIELTPELHYHLYREVIKHRQAGDDFDRTACEIVVDMVGIKNADVDGIYEYIAQIWNNTTY